MLIHALKILGVVAGFVFLSNAFEWGAALLITAAVVGVVYAYGGFDGVGKLFEWASNSEWGIKIKAWIRENIPQLANVLGIDNVVAMLEQVEDPALVASLVETVGGADKALAAAVASTIKPATAGRPADNTEWKALLAAIKQSGVSLEGGDIFKRPEVIRAIAMAPGPRVTASLSALTLADAPSAHQISLATKQRIFEAALVSRGVPAELAKKLAADPAHLVNEVFKGDKLKALLDGNYAVAFRGTLPALANYLGGAEVARLIAAGGTTAGPFSQALETEKKALLTDKEQLKALAPEVVRALMPEKSPFADIITRLTTQAAGGRTEWPQFVDVVMGARPAAFSEIMSGGPAAQAALKDPALITAVAQAGSLSRELKTQLFLSAFTTQGMSASMARVLSVNPEGLVRAIDPTTMLQLVNNGKLDAASVLRLQTYLRDNNQIDAFANALVTAQTAARETRPVAGTTTNTKIMDGFVSALASMTKEQIEQLDPRLVQGSVAALMGRGETISGNAMQLLANPSLITLVTRLDLDSIKALFDKANIALAPDMQGMLAWLKQPSATAGKQNIDILATMFKEMGVGTMTAESRAKVDALITGLQEAIKTGKPEAITSQMVAMLRDQQAGGDQVLGALATAIKAMSIPELSAERAQAMIDRVAKEKAGVFASVAAWASGTTVADVQRMYQEGMASLQTVLGNPVNLTALRDTLAGVKPQNADAVATVIADSIQGKPLNFATLAKVAGDDVMALAPLLKMDFSGLMGQQKVLAELTRDNLGRMLKFAEGMQPAERTAFFAALTPQTNGSLDMDKVLETLDTLAKKYPEQWRQHIAGLSFRPYATGLDGKVDAATDRRMRALEGQIRTITDDLPAKGATLMRPADGQAVTVAAVLLGSGVTSDRPRSTAVEEQEREALLRAVQAIAAANALEQGASGQVARPV